VAPSHGGTGKVGSRALCSAAAVTGNTLQTHLSRQENPLLYSSVPPCTPVGGTDVPSSQYRGQVNLAAIDCEHIRELGDEQVARQEKDSEGERKDKQTRLDEYKNAVRANRQLVVVLQDQGLNEVADHFTFRAQLLQRVVLGWQKQYGKWFFSVFLGALTGYGYRIWHIFVAYGLLHCLFATIYYFNPIPNLHLTWYQQVGWALVVSLTAFHTRTTVLYTPDTLMGGVVALEGIFGLVTEALFVAMLIQRFFGK
jgi:hypothetical protein